MKLILESQLDSTNIDFNKHQCGIYAFKITENIKYELTVLLPIYLYKAITLLIIYYHAILNLFVEFDFIIFFVLNLHNDLYNN